VQKIAEIGATFLFTVAAMEGAAYLGELYAAFNPVGAVISALLLGALLAYALEWVKLQIVELQIQT